MGKKLSHDQKRKAKLKKRAERSNPRGALAYTGNKYRTDEYTPIFFASERGVMESHLMLDRALTDDDVAEAIESLVTQLRGTLPPYPTEEEARELPHEPRDVIISSIRRNWLDLLDDGRGPSRDDLIGVLRTILSSIQFRRDPGKGSLGYLRHLEDFLAGSGFSIRVEKGQPELPPEPSDDPKALESQPEADCSPGRALCYTGGGSEDWNNGTAG